MGPGSGRRTQDKDRSLRRLAVQIASQLPEDPDDARHVIALMMELVDGFLAPQPKPARQFSILDGGATRSTATDD